jgi:hypothetical protein
MAKAMKENRQSIEEYIQTLERIRSIGISIKYPPVEGDEWKDGA